MPNNIRQGERWVGNIVAKYEPINVELKKNAALSILCLYKFGSLINLLFPFSLKQ